MNGNYHPKRILPVGCKESNLGYNDGAACRLAVFEL